MLTDSRQWPRRCSFHQRERQCDDQINMRAVACLSQRGIGWLERRHCSQQIDWSLMPSDTISPEAGKRYLTRQRGITGAVREAGAGLEGHFTDGAHLLG